MKIVQLIAGAIATLVHDGQEFVARSGILEIPEHLVSLALSHGASHPTPEQIAATEAAKAKAEAEAAENDPNSAPADDVDTMSRKELFASLKALNIGVQLPKTNDELRVILKAALANTPAAQQGAAEGQQAAATEAAKAG